MEVDDFVEFADDARFGGFSVSLEVDVVRFSCVVGFVFVEMEKVVVAAGAEAFGVESHFSFASFADCDFWFPVYFFVTSVAEAFGVMLFFRLAVDTLFYHVLKKAFVHYKVCANGHIPFV